ncbi:MAG TPA: arsinothricin resistance N-acetyltransferase ArsN1 [Bacillota bacterium]|jgi:L-amino acid N-acyltransferase YncA|nr:arsinothricin resistance N-acetyltransferase ArsN1 [Bacillota bacterium]HRS20756.1 arsinothricin resistance N-acetyltransferase ArsN1 [Clostridia bacterium]HRU41186.1 arsinothricin resistance N-acetyltransferase ArsN1 [Candidatus Diapherotrites archaeon]HOS69440.1 arsinothricin resistance N-acetyltransferase ArsN1 [Bacillota bacterium]HQE66232.1 arsinothricin resistance N-acetyltransferase ArsN1 [Bacillota bacterium]
MSYSVRESSLEDIQAITVIYNQGIEDRIATLESCPKKETDMIDWFSKRDEAHKVLVIEDDNGNVWGWASLNPFNSRCCYNGVVDISIYIERSMRGKGLGKILINALIETARKQGFHKLVLSTFKINEAGQRLYKSAGFREVGTYINQGILDGKWVDVTIMEKLLVNDFPN